VVVCENRAVWELAGLEVAMFEDSAVVCDGAAVLDVAADWKRAVCEGAIWKGVAAWKGAAA